MRYKELGNTGIKASVVGIGTWSISGWRWGGADFKESIKAMHASFDAGVNFIDTAPVYGLGDAEAIVRDSIKERRHKVIIATKCGLRWDESETPEKIESTIHTCLTPDSIKYELKESLKRIGTDYIDLYQTHWPDANTPIAETMNTLIDLKKDGLIRAIGVSNVSIKQLNEYWKSGIIDTDQEKINILEREIEKEIIPWCLKHNVSVIAYSPLAQGLLTGKSGPERIFDEDDDRSKDKRFSYNNRVNVQNKLSRTKDIADRYNVSYSQLAISWVLAKQGVTHALCGARSVKQAQENVHAADILLSDKDLKEIENIYGN